MSKVVIYNFLTAGSVAVIFGAPFVLKKQEAKNNKVRENKFIKNKAKAEIIEEEISNIRKSILEIQKNIENKEHEIEEFENKLNTIIHKYESEKAPLNKLLDEKFEYENILKTKCGNVCSDEDYLGLKESINSLLPEIIKEEEKLNNLIGTEKYQALKKYTALKKEKTKNQTIIKEKEEILFNKKSDLDKIKKIMKQQ